MEWSRANVMQPIASTSNLNRSPPVRPTPSGNSSTAFNDLASCVDARIQAETFQNSQQLGSDSVLQSSNPVLHIDNTGGGAEDTEMELEEDYNPVASTSAIRPIPLPLPLLRYTVKRAIVPSKTTPNIISFNEKDFEISDGSSDQWPTVFEDLYEESSISYHKEVEPALDHSWRKNIGIYLAQALGLARE